jgi:hypothetical protein
MPRCILLPQLGRTPLHRAEGAEAVAVLIAGRADIEAKDKVRSPS